ncbi:hypothetical protein PMZ80_005535 [Knufia obscura]|uniref:Uncharacterized protein n=1 Tax=Knufia obscura TaxID=1635080 RepID=A0ABR0RMI0_9EURO|nr:hypothetical protein PMZ80_005535 [Knufia obscura]
MPKVSKPSTPPGRQIKSQPQSRLGAPRKPARGTKRLPIETPGTPTPRKRHMRGLAASAIQPEDPDWTSHDEAELSWHNQRVKELDATNRADASLAERLAWTDHNEALDELMFRRNPRFTDENWEDLIKTKQTLEEQEAERLSSKSKKYSKSDKIGHEWLQEHHDKLLARGRKLKLIDDEGSPEFPSGYLPLPVLPDDIYPNGGWPTPIFTEYNWTQLQDLKKEEAKLLQAVGTRSTRGNSKSGDDLLTKKATRNMSQLEFELIYHKAAINELTIKSQRAAVHSLEDPLKGRGTCLPKRERSAVPPPPSEVLPKDQRVTRAALKNYEAKYRDKKNVASTKGLTRGGRPAAPAKTRTSGTLKLTSEEKAMAKQTAGDLANMRRRRLSTVRIGVPKRRAFLGEVYMKEVEDRRRSLETAMATNGYAERKGSDADSLKMPGGWALDEQVSPGSPKYNASIVEDTASQVHMRRAPSSSTASTTPSTPRSFHTAVEQPPSPSYPSLPPRNLRKPSITYPTLPTLPASARKPLTFPTKRQSQLLRNHSASASKPAVARADTFSPATHMLRAKYNPTYFSKEGTDGFTEFERRCLKMYDAEKAREQPSAQAQANLYASTKRKRSSSPYMDLMETEQAEQASEERRKRRKMQDDLIMKLMADTMSDRDRMARKEDAKGKAWWKFW